MATAEFQAGLTELEDLAQKQRTFIMCVEAVLWRCHRSLIADALTVAGWYVFHIMRQKAVKDHALTNFLAHNVEDVKLVYPQIENITPPAS